MDFIKGMFTNIFGIAFFIAMTGGFIQHVVTCVYEDRIFLLFAGIFFFPVGIIHGIGVWIGVW